MSQSYAGHRPPERVHADHRLDAERSVLNQSSARWVPFIGVGATGLTAGRLGRRFIGCAAPAVTPGQNQDAPPTTERNLERCSWGRSLSLSKATSRGHVLRRAGTQTTDPAKFRVRVPHGPNNSRARSALGRGSGGSRDRVRVILGQGWLRSRSCATSSPRRTRPRQPSFSPARSSYATARR